jgi:hypothetical protein
VFDPRPIPGPSLDPVSDPPVEQSGRTGGGAAPFVAPLPFKDTQIGWGLLAGEMARLGGDAWRLRGAVSSMEINYDFYGIGEDAGELGKTIPLKQPVTFAVATGSRRVVRSLYLGAAILWMHTEVRLRDSLVWDLPFPKPDVELPTTTLFPPGAVLEYDTRDDDYWPTRGSDARVSAHFFVKALGGSRVFQRYMAAWSSFAPLHGPRVILAANANFAGAAGDVPFYALPSVGSGRYGLRGYTQGRYRDNVMTTVQAELCCHTAGRFGAAAFGGFGQVAPDVYGGMFYFSVGEAF